MAATLVIFFLFERFHQCGDSFVYEHLYIISRFAKKTKTNSIGVTFQSFDLLHILVPLGSFEDHRAITKSLHLDLSNAITLIWFQDIPCATASFSTCRIQVCAGLPVRLLPCGFQSIASLVMSPLGFLRLCPIHLHFLLSSSDLMGTWFVLCHRVWLLIVSGQNIFKTINGILVIN